MKKILVAVLSLTLCLTPTVMADVLRDEIKSESLISFSDISPILDKVGLDTLAVRVSALGVPSLVLIIIMATTGFAGAAAFVTALAVLGGPFGMWGGMITMGTMVIISGAVAKFGLTAVFQAVLTELYKKGITKYEIIEHISGYPITISLKKNLIDHINKVDSRAYIAQSCLERIIKEK